MPRNIREFAATNRVPGSDITRPTNTRHATSGKPSASPPSNQAQQPSGEPLQNIAKLYRIAAMASVALFFALITFHSLTVAINTPTHHLDGAFQTAAGLFRLQSGQFPGRDFFPYLGVGPLLMIFPVFVISGGGLAASIFSAQFMTMALGWICLSVLWKLIFSPTKTLHSFAAGAIIFAVAEFNTRTPAFLDLFRFAYEPGNSLRPIRAAAPYLVAFAILSILTRCETRFRRNIFVGLLFGITMLWSNDYAVSTVGLFSLFFCIYIYIIDEGRWITSVMTVGLIALFSWLGLIWLITAGNPIALLKYNFVDVPGDQWWYFATYGASTRIFHFSQLSMLITKDVYLPLAVLFCALLIAYMTKRYEYVLVAVIGSALFVGGSVASIGGHLGGYFAAFIYWGLVTTVLLLLRLAGLFMLIPTTSSRSLFAFQSGVLFVMDILLIVFVYIKFFNYTTSLEYSRTNSGIFYVRALGGYLGIDWKDYIDYARKNRDKKVIEEYWGIWSSLNNNVPSWPVDAAIHALGNVRNLAKLALKDADLVISTRYSTSPEWQPWNLSQNYWFYDELISKWKPVFLSPTTIVWQKSDESWETFEVGCRVSERGDSVMIDSEIAGFFRLTLNYKFFGAGRYLLMFRNNISFGADADGYVSLPVDSMNAQIPVYLTKQTGNLFDIRVVGNDRISGRIFSCTASKILFSNNEILHERSASEFYLTDANWIRGISRRSAGFFVPNRPPFSDIYRVGKYVYMKNGDYRIITDIKANGKYLNVRVEGPVLDFDRVGLPSDFLVVTAPSVSTNMNLRNFYLSDSNWKSGISRNWAGFFVPNEYYYLITFKVGERVRLKDGDTRRITSVSAHGEYLHIHIDGEIPDPDKSGSPVYFSIVGK